MKVPTFKSAPRKYKSQTINFGGLNLSDGAKAGELRSSYNLSSNRAPFLSPRAPRTSQGTFSRPTALYGWNGLLVVDGTDLIYNGEIVGTVSEGYKQFATINTKLCIFPDKKYLDLTNSEFKSLEANLTAGAGTVTFGTDYMEMDIDPFIETGSSQFTYPTEPKVKVCTSLDWDSETGWSKIGESEVDITDVTVGKFMIPTRVAASGALVIPTKTGDAAYTGAENNEGYYFEVTAATDNQTAQYKWEKWNVETGVGAVWIPMYRTDNIIWHDPVTGQTEYEYVLGHYEYYPYSIKGSISYGYVYGASGTYPNNGASGGYWYVAAGTSGFTGIMTIGYSAKRFVDVELFTDHFKVGDIVNVSGCTSITANNKNDLQIVTVADDRLTFAASTFTGGSEAAAVTVSRLIPDFSFICEKDNRLWGIHGQTIKCSALGDPTNFNEFIGVSTDSYAVAVATEGDFTGICSFSEELYCWKENKLHKILGSFPAEYQMYTYDVEGVQAGSHKSIAIINETLFYKGRTGVYSLSPGSTPRLISYNLGIKDYSNAVGGDDGVKYYISMQLDNVWGLYVYDTLHNTWHQEDETRAVDFAFQNGKLYFLNSDTGEIINTSGAADDETVEWYGELELHEDTLSKKGYSRLFIRAELGDTSYLKVETNRDGGAYVQAYITHNESARTVTIPLLPGRCDTFGIKLSGKGPCVMKAIEREFTLGSEL